MNLQGDTLALGVSVPAPCPPRPSLGGWFSSQNVWHRQGHLAAQSPVRGPLPGLGGISGHRGSSGCGHGQLRVLPPDTSGSQAGTLLAPPSSDLACQQLGLGSPLSLRTEHMQG